MKRREKRRGRTSSYPWNDILRRVVEKNEKDGDGREGERERERRRPWFPLPSCLRTMIFQEEERDRQPFHRHPPKTMSEGDDGRVREWIERERESESESRESESKERERERKLTDSYMCPQDANSVGNSLCVWTPLISKIWEGEMRKYTREKERERERESMQERKKERKENEGKWTEVFTSHERKVVPTSFPWSGSFCQTNYISKTLLLVLLRERERERVQQRTWYKERVEMSKNEGRKKERKRRTVFFDQ